MRLQYTSFRKLRRLWAEHRGFTLELIQIEEASNFSSHKAIEMEETGKSIPEEPRIIPIKTKKRVGNLSRSCKGIQGLQTLLKKRLEDIKNFGDRIRRHFSEEKEIVFPIVL